MPLAPAFSLAYRAGDDILLEFLVEDANGTVANITGATVKFAVAEDKTSPIITTEGVTPTATWTITDPMNGLFQVAIAGEETQDLRGTYPCDAALDDVFGATVTVAQGYLTFTADLV